MRDLKNKIKTQKKFFNRKFIFLQSFTLIEILVVATIIGLLAAGGIVSYSQFSKQARDAKRKADLEQIRAALEMYRSNNQNNSYPNNLNSLVPGYIISLPTDPKTNNNYQYTPQPAGCNSTSSNPCTSYILSSTLETGGNYFTNPYGGSNTIPTPSPTPTQQATPIPTRPATPTPRGGYSCSNECSFPIQGGSYSTQSDCCRFCFKSPICPNQF